MNDDVFNCGSCKNRAINPKKPLHGVHPRPCSRCALAFIADKIEDIYILLDGERRR